MLHRKKDTPRSPRTPDAPRSSRTPRNSSPKITHFKLKKAKADTKLSTSHADLEGMLSTVGVLAALVLSVQVGLFLSIPMEEILLPTTAAV